MAIKVPRIVVVEDDASMRQALERILRSAGFAPVVLASAEAALESESLTRADCWVLDIQLPGMSGFEFYERKARAGDEAPTIFITAHDEPFNRARAENLGAKAYLTKPFSGRALLDSVTQALETK